MQRRAVRLTEADEARVRALVLRSHNPSSRTAALLKRVFGVDVLQCSPCRASTELIACIEQPDMSKNILEHLGSRAEPLRSPPCQALCWTKSPSGLYRSVRTLLASVPKWGLRPMSTRPPKVIRRRDSLCSVP